jgi:asparagine synthase (glutamine-hydrolysing)
MCGIAGELNLKNNVSYNKAVNSTLEHRGPDNSSYLRLKKNLYFYHTRLKIIDLSDDSNQPMVSQNSRYTIIFNGEFYNFRDIKKELIKKGYNFKTTGDTEVFLNGFVEWGTNFFNKVNGIFATSIFDKKLNCIYFARDFIGVKPLYYFFDDYSFAFSSELKTLLKIKKSKCNLNEKLLNEFLYYKYITGKETLVKNIFKFDPGKVYKIDLNNKKIKLTQSKYYNFNEISNNDSIKDATAKTNFLLKKSINLQLQSDANLGIQLSGGVDSTLITELACEQQNIQYLFFSSFKNFKKDESNYAYKVEKKLNIKLKSISLNKSYFDKNFKKAIYYLDEPLNHPHSLAIYQISKKARNNVSVLLSGEGADELFFGYERYNSLLKKNISTMDLIKNGAFLRDDADLELFNQFKKGRHQVNPHENRIKLFNKINVDNIYKKFQLFETQTHLQSLLLRSDKMMMANSIEARVPFLDKQLYDYSINLSDKIKKNKINKIILKKILKQKLYSDNFIFRKKIGYIVPFNNWVKTKKNFEKDLINENLLNYFDKKKLKDLSFQLSQKKNIYSNAKMFWLMKNLNNFINIFELN